MKRSALFVSILALLACGTRTSLPTDTPVTDSGTASDASDLDAAVIDDGAADSEAATSTDDASDTRIACFSSDDCVDEGGADAKAAVCCGGDLDAGKQGTCSELCGL